MSDKYPLPIAKAKAIELLEQLRPACHKIDIAGSIRRGKPLVKDIEIVCQPRTIPGLFDGFSTISNELDSVLAELVKTGTLQCGDKNGEKYKNFIVQPIGIKLDLFIVTPPAQYGCILAIRTGPGDFSKKIVTQRQKGGLLPSYLKVKEGVVWNGKNALSLPTEEDFFNLLGTDWIEPSERGAA